MRSTGSRGELAKIPDCYIYITGLAEVRKEAGITEDDSRIYARILPDISDSKSASYSDEAIIGRSSPFKTYSHSENRTISWTSYFMVTEETDILRNWIDLRAIQSVTYPRDNFAPYAPPPVCSIKCGMLLGRSELCVVLKSYTVKFPTDVSWDNGGPGRALKPTYLPYKFSVDMSWDVVYQSDNLPGYEKIIRGF